MSGEAFVEGGVAVGFGGAVFERAGVAGAEEVRAVEEGFGALGYEGGGGVGVGEGERKGGGVGWGDAHCFHCVGCVDGVSLQGGGEGYARFRIFW